MLLGLGGGFCTSDVGVFGGKAGGFPRGSRGLPDSKLMRGSRGFPESGERGIRREARGLDCGVGKVGVGGMEEPSRGSFFREVSEKLRLERLRLRSRLSGWSESEPPLKLVVTLWPLIRVTAICVPA